MSNESSKHGNPEGHENFEHETFEHQDLSAASILYFLLTLGVVTVLCMFGLKGLYSFLDHRERSSQPSVNPLVTNVPEDTRHVARGYPEAAFPSPRLEEDERGQRNGIRTAEDQTLYSYGWVDEKAGTVRIPIERAMDLLVQRGLPVHSQSASGAGPASKAGTSKSQAEGNQGETQ
jgi:hypothetical protein